MEQEQKQLPPALCSWCGKPLLGEIARPGDRPGWCHDCSTKYGDVAVIVCRNCGHLIGGILPGPHDSGYIVKKNEVLHTRECPKCHPGIMKAEVEEFAKAMKEKYEHP